MINYSEESAVKLSPTKKDFYQIWNELLDVASKLSERWDPTSTNESDPGIVLLKVLTAVADKLNYNIDANILEAFMPSAAQEDSMRKLCDMLGYNMKYYQSASTNVKISYNKVYETGVTVTIDKFSNIKDTDDSINYITLNEINLNKDTPSKIVSCLEGELVECETDNDNIISLLNIDDNKRYYLPETQIAENGIFISNVDNGIETDTEDWTKVDNLNGQPVKTKVYKFGFDSKENLPYIQFPDDISAIIEDGLKIKYVRTKGINGNISAKTLCKLEKPISWSNDTSSTESESETDAEYHNVDNYTVYNVSASTTGSNCETINEAYYNYNKTIGTFNTLVTCRDYMNKIYNMTMEDANNTNLVSNIIVSDIRDDINKAMTVCTFNETGVEYKNIEKPAIPTIDGQLKKSEFETLKTKVKNNDPVDPLDPEGIKYGERELNKTYWVSKDETLLADSKDGYYKCVYNGNYYEFIKLSETAIDHFDLVFYPFKNTYGLNTKSEFVKSFKYDSANLTEIKQNLETCKTVSHNIISPTKNEIACIKNYFKLDARITTIHKVTALEQASILANVYAKLYETFNMHKVDFGEELTYDTILEVLESADSRIKNVSLEDPTLDTRICTVAGGEYNYKIDTDTILSESEAAKLKVGQQYYNSLVLNNVMAGRVHAFNYDTNFKPLYRESVYPSWGSGTGDKFNLLYPADISDTSHGLAKMTSEFKVLKNSDEITLNNNEVIQFRMPNLKTTTTYPAYVNYYLHLVNTTGIPAVPATMYSLKAYLDLATTGEQQKYNTNWEALINNSIFSEAAKDIVKYSASNPVTEDEFNAAVKGHHAVFIKHIPTEEDDRKYIRQTQFEEGLTEIYYITITNGITSNYTKFDAWVKGQVANYKDSEGHLVYLNGLYYIKDKDLTRSIGELVDIDHARYMAVTSPISSTDPFNTYYVQHTWSSDVLPDGIRNISDCHMKTGLGQTGEYSGIKADEEYKLKSGEYLLINYTHSTSEDGNETKTKINEIFTGDDKDSTTGDPIIRIIKPNFELIDSKNYRELHSYSKTDQSWSFEGYNIDGMFTLGTNEQIEMREFVQVKLDEVNTQLYWERNDEVPDSNDRILFKFEDEPINKLTGEVWTGTLDPAKEEIDWRYSAYTLKSGEYLYYTDANKSDIAYYGAGAKIKRTHLTPKIFKSSKDTALSSEEIATSGISASIPWRGFDLSSGKTLTIIEYQYINLVNGDKLATLTNSTQTVDKIDLDLTNSWIKCKSATYTTSGTAKSLPVVDIGDTISWEVRSRFEFNLGADTEQIIYPNDYINLYNDLGNLMVTLTPHNEIPVAVKANKILQSASDNIDVTTIEYDEDGGIKNKYYETQIKVLSVENITNTNNTSVNLYNFGDGEFTKLTFEDAIAARDGSAYVTLNALIPENRFGLIMFQNNKTAVATNNIGIRFIKPYASYSQTICIPKIYNNVDTTENDIWWADSTYTKTVWAALDGNISRLSETEFNANKTYLYKAVAVSPTPANPQPDPTKPLQYYDGEYLYNLTKVAASDTYNATTFYTKLLDVGGNKTIYELRDGINIVKIDSACKIEIYPDTNKSDILVFDNLDIVYTTSTDNSISAVNPKICYKPIDTTTDGNYVSIETQFKRDMRKIDQNHIFYYNNTIDNKASIDLNDLDDEDTLEHPLNWFDYNNINNKFVISEIDADYLSTGVTIARGSKI